MKKKMLIITAGLGIIGFAGMFAVGWITRPKPQPAAEDSTTLQAGIGTPVTPEQMDAASAADKIAALAGQDKHGMTEQQLRALIYEVRDKIKQYNDKMQELKVQEQRLQAAHEELKKDIDEMASLRVELASTVATLKDEQQKLLNTKLEIEATEQENLKSIAAAYDKMDSESAGKILMNMVKNSNSPTSSDDAVKILYFMTERTKAKVLASMAEAEPAVSAYICQRLKRMITKE